MSLALSASHTALLMICHCARIRHEVSREHSAGPSGMQSVTAIGLFTVGAVKTVVTNTHPVKSGLENLVIAGIGGFIAEQLCRELLYAEAVLPPRRRKGIRSPKPALLPVPLEV